MEDLILNGDVYSCLCELPSNSVRIVVTSPPYWKQRDYGFEGQIGREMTPEEYIGRLITIFDKILEKMTDDGVFFLNIGDKYLSRYGKSMLLQIPYRLAYHMVRRGWYLADILIWYKPNHMPSSVKDRFTNTYEPVLVFTKTRDSVYKKGAARVLEVPLQATPWKHTAVFPEALVAELLNRVDLRDGDVVLDPFAGTGTTAKVVCQLGQSFYGKRLYSIMIEKNEEFVSIIENRAKIKKVIKVKDIPYSWEAIKDVHLPELPEPKVLLEDRYGEICIVDNSQEFMAFLKGFFTEEFKQYHREDALFFLGVREYNLDALYYSYSLNRYGYVLRNMLVVKDKQTWFPVFMFAKDTKRVAYRFYIDRVRVPPKSDEKRNWAETEFLGMRVQDILSKNAKKGQVTKIIAKYEDGFPRLVEVRWEDRTSIEFAIHPLEDEFVMEGLELFCPFCGERLENPFDPIGENICPKCGKELWKNLRSVPVFKEPNTVVEALNELEKYKAQSTKSRDIQFSQIRNIPSRVMNTKFYSMDRVNWGASPGARKVMLGEYFTKMRLYRIDQPAIAQYLTLLRKDRGLGVHDVVNRLPDQYKHTVGHWFRKDFGGSLPMPEDVELIEEILSADTQILTILKRTGLKLQTVKTSVKGRNGGDYIKDKTSTADLENYFRKLYAPSKEYLLAIDRHQ
mgnify:FL=1